MCDPVSIGMLAVSAASAAFQYEGTRKAASVSADFAQRSYAANDSAVQAQQVQVGEQSAQQMSDRARQAMIERGHLVAMQAMSGVGGNTDARLMAGVDFAEGTDEATLQANRQNYIAQGQRSKSAGQLETEAQMASIKQPSLLGAGLQIAGSALDTPYARSLTKPTSKAPSIYDASAATNPPVAGNGGP